jgi:hypothetical protein
MTFFSMNYKVRIQMLGTALCLAIPAYPVDYYQNTNRDLYYLPQSIGMAKADLATARTGAPNANPANACLGTSTELSLSYAGLYGNVASISSFSSVSPVSKNDAFGLSLNYLMIPNIEITENWPVDNAGNPIVPPESEWQMGTASEIFFHAGYGHKFEMKRADIGLGAACNAQRRRLPGADGFITGYGLSLDAGAAIRFNKIGVILSLFGQDITTNYLSWTPGYSENGSPHIRFAAGIDKEIPYIYGRIRLGYTSLDLLGNEGVNGAKSNDPLSEDSIDTPQQIHPSKEPFTFIGYGNWGGEYTIAHRVALRVGLENARRWSFGAGLNVMDGRLSFDFAYASFIAGDLPGTYQMAVSYRWL